MNAVKIERKELSNGLKAVLIDNGMTVREIVRVFGIPKQTVLDHIKSRGFKRARKTGHALAILREQQVVPINQGSIDIVPQTAIESLIRFISTPETDAIYKQLWGVARSVHLGDIQTARQIVGLDVGLPDPSQVTSAMVLAVIQHLQVEADKERALRLSEQKAHAETKRTAKISRVQLPDLLAAIGVKAGVAEFEISTEDRPRDKIRCASVIKKVIKARWCNALRIETFKEISAGDLPIVLQWVESLPSRMVLASWNFANTNEGLQQLRAFLVRHETVWFTSSASSMPASQPAL